MNVQHRTSNVQPRLGVDEIGEFMLRNRSALPVYKLAEYLIQNSIWLRKCYATTRVGRSMFDVHLLSPPEGALSSFEDNICLTGGFYNILIGDY